MRVLAEIPQLEKFRGCALVPTMGALHEGHLALVRRARETGRPVVVSIFVNPTQFTDSGDFDRYPRDLDGDLKKTEATGADAVFAPDTRTMYPRGAEAPVPPLPDVATKPGLEDRFRPGHFAGVCQVVARLFDLVRPQVAVFGEKDYQQLKVIEELVRQEGGRWPGLEIIPQPTIREDDGLAMSSRNVLLSVEERRRALGLSAALAQAKAAVSPGRIAARIEELMRAVLVRHRVEVEYAAVRDAETLMPIDVIEHRPARALIAARVGDVRLIDNDAI